MRWSVGRFGLTVVLVALVFSTLGALLGITGQMQMQGWTKFAELLSPVQDQRLTRSACDISEPEPPFIKLDELYAVNFSQRVPAPGCPPQATGRLCRLQDVFDEIILISLPRLTERLTRARAQLRDLGVPYTLIHAFDAKGLANAADLAKIVMQDPREQHPGVFSLYLTHMGVLAYIERSPSQRVLILEDDVTFCADFPRAFDARVRRIPDDWRMLWLGALVERPNYYTNHQMIERFTEVNYARPRIIATAWAVGIHRDAATLMARSLETSRQAMDRRAFVDALKKWPLQSYIMWPPVAASNPYSGSTLGHGWPIAPAEWARDNGIDLANFDFQRGYHRGGELGSELRCVFTDQGEGVTWEYPAESVVSEAVLPTADQCCATCSADWPRCQAWQWRLDSGRCVLAKTWAAEAVTKPGEVVSGRIVQEDSTFHVPNVVHFVYTPRVPRLDVWVYISVLSAAINTNPDAIRWHHRELPQGPWWECTRPLLSSLDVVDDVTSIHGRPFPNLSEAHKSDVTRLQVLMREGGIYLDTDTLVLRSFDPLRTRNAVSLGKDGAETNQKQVGSGVLVAPRNASFLQRWWAEYQTFDSRWNFHSCIVSRQLAERYPSEVNLLPHTAFYPRSWQRPHLTIAYESDDCRSEADSYAVHMYNSAVDGTAKGRWVPPTDDYAASGAPGDGEAEMEAVWLGKGSLHRVARQILRKALAAGRLCPLAERVVAPLAAQGDEYSYKCVPAIQVRDPTIPLPSDQPDQIDTQKPSVDQQNSNDDKTPADQAQGADEPKNDQSDTTAATDMAAEGARDETVIDTDKTADSDRDGAGDAKANEAVAEQKVSNTAAEGGGNEAGDAKEADEATDTDQKSNKADSSNKKSKAIKEKKKKKSKPGKVGGSATLSDLLMAGTFGRGVARQMRANGG